MAALITKSLPMKINKILKNAKVLTAPITLNRQICVGETYYGRSQLANQGKMLKKIMVGGSKKKWYKDPVHVLEKPQLGTSEYLKPKKTLVNRRVTVLNSVLINNICDIISNGELSPELLGLGLEITRVKVNSDFTCVNVYWMTSIAENSVIIKDRLRSNAGNLRVILNSLRILGNVPYIIFVKDLQHQNIKDVEYALARADFGPDYEPTDRSHRLKSTVILKQTLPDLPELLVKEDQKVERSTLKYEPLITTSTSPPEQMRMDLYGLNHEKMLTSIVQKMNASKACYRTSESGVPMGTNSPIDENEDEKQQLSSDVVKRSWSSLRDPTTELKKILRRSERLKRRDHSKEEVKKLLTEEIRNNSANDGPVLGENFSDLYDEEDYYNEEEEDHFEREK